MPEPTESRLDGVKHAPYLHELALGSLATLTMAALIARAGLSHPVARETAAAATLLLVVLTLLSQRPSTLSLKLRFVASFLFVTWFYAATRRIVPALGLELWDSTLLAADEALFGVTPAHVLGRFATPLLTDGLSVCYLAYFAYLNLAFLDSLRGCVDRATRLAPALLLAFALGLAGYLLVPAVGPTAAFPSLFPRPLPGSAISRDIAHFVASHSSVYDAFPSLHTLVTAVLLAHDRLHARTRFYLMLGPAAGLLIATLYLRYHYGIDLIAAFALFLGIGALHRRAAPPFEVRPTAALGARDRAALIELAGSISPCAEGGAYVAQRFDRYPLVVTAVDGDACGFALLDGFVERGETHLYVGPMFSRGGAAALMIAGLVQTLSARRGEAFHLAAEVQNPVIIDLLERLVPSAVYPRRCLDAIPPGVERAAHAFARRIAHVQGFDAGTWRTRSKSSLYAPVPSRGAIAAWLAARGVDLERGDAQLVLVSCPNEPERRAALHRELSSGLASLRRGRSAPAPRAYAKEASHV